MSFSKATGDLFEPLGVSFYEAVRTGPAALAGAFLSTSILLAGSLLLGQIGLGLQWVLPAGFLLVHVVFIIAIADVTARRMAGEPFTAARARIWLINGLLLSVVLAAIAALGVAAGLPVGARNGQVLLLTGWAVLSLSAAPSLMLDRSGSRRPSAWALGGRLIACAAWGFLLALLGEPIHGCRGECWGLFEGGLFAIPFAGAYLFLTCLSCGVLSAVFTARATSRSS